MRILHLISSGGMYGAEAVILDLSRSLLRAGHQPALGIFANSLHPNTEFEGRAKREGFETHVIPCSGRFDRTVPRQVRDLVRSASIDVVQAHGYKADVYAFGAFRRSETPVISTCHNWIEGDLALRLYSALDRLALRRFPAVVAVSEGVRQRLLTAGVRPERIHLIRNGVDLHPFAAAQSSTPPRPDPQALRVGLVARLSREKGVDIFLDAAALVHKQVPQVRFVIAGDGPDRASLEAQIQQLGLQDCVSLAGRQEDMPGFYTSLDVLALSSRQEGLPMALLEGMASGLPVVATAVGEVPQVIENGITGLVVAPEDPAALAAGLIDLLTPPERRIEMGRLGQARVTAGFSADRMAAEYLHVYQSVASQRGRAVPSHASSQDALDQRGS